MEIGDKKISKLFCHRSTTHTSAPLYASQYVSKYLGAASKPHPQRKKYPPPIEKKH